jgi:hypothetical protein
LGEDQPWQKHKIYAQIGLRMGQACGPSSCGMAQELGELASPVSNNNRCFQRISMAISGTDLLDIYGIYGKITI